MHDDVPAYGLWPLVIINSAVFIFFAFTFFKPQTKRDWRSFAAFSAFLVALFTEMYGFPLTIYLFSGWLQTQYPDVDWFSDDSGHLLEMMFGWKANPHFGPFHLLSFAFIGGGFILISTGWQKLYEAQRKHTLAFDRHLFIRPPPAVCRLRAGDVRLPIAMADPSDTRDVPGPGHHVRATGSHGGAGGFGPIRSRGYERYMHDVPRFVPRIRDIVSGPKHGRA